MSSSPQRRLLNSCISRSQRDMLGRNHLRSRTSFCMRLSRCRCLQKAHPHTKPCMRACLRCRQVPADRMSRRQSQPRPKRCARQQGGGCAAPLARGTGAAQLPLIGVEKGGVTPALPYSSRRTAWPRGPQYWQREGCAATVPQRGLRLYGGCSPDASPNPASAAAGAPAAGLAPSAAGAASAGGSPQPQQRPFT